MWSTQMISDNSSGINAPNLEGELVDNHRLPLLPLDPTSGGGESCKDWDFSDVVLKYIGQMLMEEDIEEKNCMFQESSASLQAAEKSFYDVIGQKYPPPSSQQTSSSLHQNNYISNGISSDSSVITTLDEALVDFPLNGLSISDYHFDLKAPNPNPRKESFRGRKNTYSEEDLDLESSGRGSKVSAVSSESNLQPEMFDWVLLCNGGKGESDLRESLNIDHYSHSNRSNNGRRRKHTRKGAKNHSNMVDLRTLLTQCAQAVAADDRRNAFEILKQIRQHSSPSGDGMQRLAKYFGDALEARLAGSGTQIYKALISGLASASDILKAYHLYLAVCPFRKLSNFFSNMTIMQASKNAKTLHIVDFGILYGFQWPCLIQRLSSRPGGPPKLRITGIDFPRPGFKPAERVEETGRRLKNYAERFKVPFEFVAIARTWETIRAEDIQAKEDEVLVVNSVFRFRNLLDETVVVESPRDLVLNLIRKMNPDVFILGTINGAYSAPFFMTRFREALYHYSSLFDMLHTTVPRDIPERFLLEKEVFGRELMNAIACEGLERIERPETYKQWQVRILRAGFRQLPLNDEIMMIAKDRLASRYHKDFVINENGHWLLQGWKGRIVYALSSWKPNNH